jgi:hypothetical protein
VVRLALRPGSVVDGRVYAKSPNPGRSDWRLVLQPVPQQMSVQRAFLICVVVAYAWWLILGLAFFVFWSERSTRSGGPQTSTTFDRRTPRGLACLFGGTLLACFGLATFVFTVGRDISQPPGTAEFRFWGLSSTDWLTIAGFGITVFSWGSQKSSIRSQRRGPSTTVLTISVFYLLLIAIASTYFISGSAIQHLIAPDLLSAFKATHRPLERIGDVAGPGLLLGNVVMAVTVLVLAVQHNARLRHLGGPRQ